MRKRKIAVIVSICVVLVLTGAMLFRYIRKNSIPNDPELEVAVKLFNVENALKEIDEGWHMNALSKVTPYTYADPDGNTIVYYCCQTVYVGDEIPEMDGLDTTALGLVIDFTAIENRRPCEVNGLGAFQCEMDGRTYLCWTLSPEVSCVIEYSPDVTEESDVFRIAESVQLPEDSE